MFIFVLCFGIAVVTGEVYNDPKDKNCSKMKDHFLNVACCNTSEGNPPMEIPLPQPPPETVIPPQPSENQPQQKPETMDPPQQEPDVKPKVGPPFKQCDPPGRYMVTFFAILW